ELPAEQPMNFSEPPPAAEEPLVFSRIELRAELTREVALQLGSERLHDARHRHQHRNPVRADGLNHFSRAQALLKDHHAADERRNEHAHVLSEHMTQRQQMKKAQRMKD